MAAGQLIQTQSLLLGSQLSEPCRQWGDQGAPWGGGGADLRLARDSRGKGGPAFLAKLVKRMFQLGWCPRRPTSATTDPGWPVR